MINNKIRNREEIEHFTNLEHIWWGAKTPAGQKRYDYKFDLLYKLCKLKPNVKILEIGCGDGEFTKRLTKLNAQIIATDLTPEVISRAKRKYVFKNVKFEVANAENLIYKSGTFDLVCGVSILHHLDSEKALKECKRVLKRSGYIFFTEPNLINPHTFLGLRLPYLRTRMEFSPGERAFLRWELKEQLKKVGFRKVDIRNYDFLHPNTPKKFISFVKQTSNFIEKVPIIKEISGSLSIFAVK